MNVTAWLGAQVRAICRHGATTPAVEEIHSVLNKILV
jgi:hypothetical protein